MTRSIALTTVPTMKTKALAKLAAFYLSLVVITQTFLVGTVLADDRLASLQPTASNSTAQTPVEAVLSTALESLITKWPATWYPKGKAPETEDQRKQRLTMAAQALAKQVRETDTKFLPEDAAALVLAVWYHESAGEYYVHAGGKSPLGTQDNGRARCFGQVQTWPNNTLLTPEEHSALAGLDREATERCAAATLTYFWQHAQCLPRKDWTKPLQPGEAAQLFAAYGKGSCVPVGAKSRIRAHTWSKARMAIKSQLTAESASRQAAAS